MPYNGSFYKPDFDAPNIQTPDWVQMGGDSGTPDMGGFVQALKQRMAKPATKSIDGGFTDAGKAAPVPTHEMGHIEPSTAGKGLFGGGGGKSL